MAQREQKNVVQCNAIPSLIVLFSCKYHKQFNLIPQQSNNNSIFVHIFTGRQVNCIQPWRGLQYPPAVNTHIFISLEALLSFFYSDMVSIHWKLFSFTPKNETEHGKRSRQRGNKQNHLDWKHQSWNSQICILFKYLFLCLSYPHKHTQACTCNIVGRAAVKVI